MLPPAAMPAVRCAAAHQGQAIAIQDTMTIVAKVRGLIEPHDSQPGSDGATTWREDAPHNQHQNMLPWALVQIN